MDTVKMIDLKKFMMDELQVVYSDEVWCELKIWDGIKSNYCFPERGQVFRYHKNSQSSTATTSLFLSMTTLTFTKKSKTERIEIERDDGGYDPTKIRQHPTNNNLRHSALHFNLLVLS